MFPDINKGQYSEEQGERRSEKKNREQPEVACRDCKPGSADGEEPLQFRFDLRALGNCHPAIGARSSGRGQTRPALSTKHIMAPSPTMSRQRRLGVKKAPQTTNHTNFSKKRRQVKHLFSLCWDARKSGQIGVRAKVDTNAGTPPACAVTAPCSQADPGRRRRSGPGG